MGRGRCRNRDEDNGFGAWGGYMEAKKSKLIDQFRSTTAEQTEKLSDVFEGVSIFVNGLTNPTAEELKQLMAANGGVYHTYQNSSTTHIIASNLPNVKINKLGSVPIVKPSWITDSLTLGKLLDYRRYLLYTNQSNAQPRLDFPVVPRNSPTKTASDPKFLEEFYNNSRLHLISTLGAEFKQLVTRLREESDGNFPGLASLPPRNRETSPQTGPIIMHIDMDCFFVSVGLRSRPELRGLPVAVTHARNPHINSTRDRATEIAMNVERLEQRNELIDANSSMSEIASCSYEARKLGVKNGMFLGTAAKLCPGLKTIPYDFQGYREVSNSLYATVATYTLDIEAVSCDEMYVDVSEILKTSKLTVEEWASHIRDQIVSITGCPCSTGFGSNRLQARLATKQAKPCGQFYLKPDQVEDYMSEILLSDLPGVGPATISKLSTLGLTTCGDIQVASLQLLRSELGTKSGETLWEQSRGVDKRPLNFYHERKSVSAEVNYGIRFKTLEECHNFLETLAVEVHARLTDIKMRARCVTLKLMVRSPNAPLETAKFLGHGICDNLSKSTTTNGPVSDAKSILREARGLFEKLGARFDELRGVGIQLSKLEKGGQVASEVLSRFLKQSPKKFVVGEETAPPAVGEVRPKHDGAVDDKTATSVETKTKRGRPRARSRGKAAAASSISKFFKARRDNPPKKEETPMSNTIDLDVLDALPEELRLEVIQEYGLDVATTVPSSEPQRSPFSGLNWEQLRPILYDWMKAEATPAEVDVTMLAGHFKQLAMDRKIEMLHVALKFLRRNFAGLDCRWHHAYRAIVNVTQEGMVARYGSTLMVDNTFLCCR